jgi:N6-L-threonylcarbamoyladenine synthase
MRGAQRVRHHLRLDERERRAAGADAKGPIHSVLVLNTQWVAGKAAMSLILGIESSCDETAAALVASDRRVLAHRLAGQEAAHRPFGGVVPEIAARAHVEILPRLIEETLAEAGIDLAEVDAIAATAGPGLIGGVMVGLVTAKGLALAAGKPLVAVNHLEGHALSPMLSDPDLAFPYLLLLVSGGHCQLLFVQGVGRYRRLATTIDDAAGEAFDKSAKLLGLGFPGGPAVERAAASGDAKAVPLPRPLLGSPEPHFSFAGLKSAVLRAKESGLYADADIAASFQQAVVDCLIDRTQRAIEVADGATALVVAGGVAANQAIRAALTELAAAHGLPFVAPPLWLCTDNAAMIAWAGAERLGAGLTDSLDAPARARWPLDPEAEKVRGAGVKA